MDCTHHNASPSPGLFCWFICCVSARTLLLKFSGYPSFARTSRTQLASHLAVRRHNTRSADSRPSTRSRRTLPGRFISFFLSLCRHRSVLDRLAFISFIFGLASPHIALSRGFVAPLYFLAVRGFLPPLWPGRTHAPLFQRVIMDAPTLAQVCFPCASDSNSGL